MLLSKLHRGTVTEANLEYEGSITIDEELMEAANIPEFAQVHIYNCTNGNRFETYTIKGVAGSRTICINGAAAHLATKGDIVIICCYCLVESAQVITHQPTVVLLQDDNSIKKIMKPNSLK